MAGEYCLDTNIAVAFLNGRPEVLQKVAQAKRVVLPAPVVGELLYGAKNSGMKERNLLRFRGFIQNCEVVHIDENVAEVYSSVKLQLKMQGTPIPENDIWIAACSHFLDIPLVTGDKHFDRIPDLTTENWLAD